MRFAASLLSASALGCACLGGAAHAAAPAPVRVKSSQSAAAVPAAVQLKRITVRATYIRPGGKSALKMSVPVRDIPFSLVDYGHAFMRAVDTTSLTDLYGYMSDVQRAGPSGYDISIRGFTTSATDPNSVLVDGLPGLPARTASPETADIERVEVIKGPASVLYGQAQPGGFINLITKKPRAQYHSSFELRADTYDGAGVPFGNRNTYTGIVDTTGALDSSGRVLGRFISQYTNAQSFRSFVMDKDVMVAPSLTWNISPRTKATLLLEYRHGNDSWDQGLVAPGFNSKLIAPIRTRYQNPEDKEVEKGETATLLVRHRFSRRLTWNFNARSVYTEDYEIGFDTHSVLKNLVTLSRTDRAQDNHNHYNFIDTSMTERFAIGPVKNRLLTGLTYGEIIHDYNRIRDFATPLLNIDIYDPVIGYNDVAPPPSSEPPQQHTWANDKMYAAYGTDLITFSQHWKGVVGARYEDDEQLTRELRLPNVPNTTASFNSAFPMGGIIYQPDKDWSIYASYSTSFVPPPPGAESVVPGQALKAQTASQEETGVKYQSPHGRFNATLSVFNIKEVNLIQVIGITGLYEQIGAVRSRGAELEVNARPTRWWQLVANYALVDARIIDTTVQQDIGSPTLNSPKNSASVLSRMQLPGKLHRFGWMLGVIYRSGRVGNLPTAKEPLTFIMPGYTTVTTGISYTGDSYSVALKIDNLLDKQYYQSAFSAVRITPGAPRNIALIFRKRFD